MPKLSVTANKHETKLLDNPNLGVELVYLMCFNNRTEHTGSPSIMYYTVVLYSGSAVQWYCAVVLHSGIVQWYCTVVLHSGIVQWYCTVVLYSGIVQWYCSVVLFSGIVQWYCSVVLFSIHKVTDYIQLDERSINITCFIYLLYG